MKNNNYQFFLSFGYLYIVILGFLKEAFYYGQLGVDYFKYSTVADILISPLSDITSSLTSLLVFIFVVSIIFILPNWFVKKKDKIWVQKLFKLEEEMDLVKTHKHLSNLFMASFCVGLLGFYLGGGIGAGAKIANKIDDDTLEYNDQISFTDGTSETIHLIGKNSSFLFYLPKGKEEIEITPINNGFLKSIIDKK